MIHNKVLHTFLIIKIICHSEPHDLRAYEYLYKLIYVLTINVII